MSTGSTSPLTPFPITAEERAIIELMRAGTVTDAELVTVPRTYFELIKASYQAMKAVISKAQYAVSITEYVVSQSVVK